MANVELRGLKELLERIHSLEDLRWLRDGIAAAAVNLKGKIAEYPPAGSFAGRYNLKTHKKMGHYMRGLGWVSATGRLSKSSEGLSTRWAVNFENDGLRAVIGNNASYGPWVQDRYSQTTIHRARGWKTVQDVSEQEAERVSAMLKNYLEQALEK